MKTALIGYTGFVGGNIAGEFKFDQLFNSKNIKEVGKKEYDLVVCAAPSAVKWKANQFPEEDMKIINSLMEDLKKVRTKKFVQISTVDVYKKPSDVNENTNIDIENLHPYGRHRFLLEQFIKDQFSESLIIRLPGLFGKGLKKNFIYDLMNNNALDYTHQESVFQFYNLANLWKDISIALKNNLNLINITSEPISAKEIAKKCFDVNFSNVTENAPAHYNVKTIHDSLFNGKDGYIYTKEEIIKQIKSFIKTR